MIGGMRKFARSKWALVVLFIPLVIALAISLPDNFGGGLSGGTLSKVGDREMRVNQIEADLALILEQARLQDGRVITPAEAVREGRVQALISETEMRNTILAYADKMGIAASEETLRPYLERNKALVDEFGKVSRDLILRQAERRRQSPREFAAYVRDELTQNYIRRAAGSAITVPDILSQPWIGYYGESRVISLAQVAPATVASPAEPTEAEMQAWYETNKAMFNQPERRRISVLSYTPDDFLDQVVLTDADLRAKYQERIKQYSTPETRTVVEFTADNRNTIQAFIDLTAQGIPVADALAQTPGLTRVERSLKPEDIQNEEYRKFLFEDLPVDRVHIVPIQLPNEPWKTVMITAITPGVPTPYEEIADKVRRDVAWPEAQAKYETSGEPFRDAAGGQPLEEIAKQFGIPLITLAPIDVRAVTLQQDQAKIMTENVDAMRQLFTMSAGEMTNVFEGDNVRSMFRLDEIIPPYTLPFAEVKDIVRQSLVNEKIVAARTRAAESMVAAVKAGAAFQKAAADAKLVVVPPVTVTRSTITGPDQQAVNAAFNLKVGEVGVVNGQNGSVWVARVDSVTPVTPEMAAIVRMQVGEDIANSIMDDINEVFSRGIRSEVSFQRDDAAIQKYLQGLVGEDPNASQNQQ